MDHLDAESAHRYVARTLPRPARDAADAHLARCPRCAQLVEEERRLSSFLELAPATQTPAGAAALDRILARVAAGADAPPAARRERVFATALIALAGISLVWTVGRLESARRATFAAPALPVDERPVAENLSELHTLLADEWLVEEFDAAQTLEQLIRSGRTGAGS